MRKGPYALLRPAGLFLQPDVRSRVTSQPLASISWALGYSLDQTLIYLLPGVCSTALRSC